MTMPIDLVLVRHGQSEGNIANKMSKGGDNSAFTEDFLSRHSSQWRLTNLGREQAQKAGFWIRDDIGDKFDRYYVSEYARALETAALLDLPNARWLREFYLRERDWGQLDVMSQEEKLAKFGDELKRRERDGFFWAPPGGESMANLCLRVDRVIDTLHRECSNKKVIIVCHGEVMWAFRVRLERMSQSRYHELDTSKNPFDHIHNCQIIHYTRREFNNDGIYSDKLLPFLHSFRSVCPTNKELSRNTWETIQRNGYDNKSLLNEVEKINRLIDNK